MPQAAPASKPLHIFKPGQWTTMAGEKIEFSESDLQASAQAYDPKISKAPLVKGHPKADKPAQGWAVSLTASERGLFAAADKVDPEFAEDVRSGRFGTISAKFYRPTDPSNPVPGVWYLRHIGFLGAQPPAVKGLDDPEFAQAEDDDGVCFQEGVAFGEWDGMTNATLWRSLREWILGKFGAEEADKVLPGYEVRALELGAQENINQRRLHDSGPVAFADNTELANAGGDTSRLSKITQPPPQESAMTEEEAARLREEGAAKDRQIAELQAAEAKRKEAGVLADNVAFAESMASETRIPAALKGQVAAIGAQLQSTPDVEFGEGDAKKPLHELFRDFLRALPKQVEFGEQATRERAADSAEDTPVEFSEGADPTRLDQDKRIRAHAKQHGVSYATAAHAVMRAK